MIERYVQLLLVFLSKCTYIHTSTHTTTSCTGVIRNSYMCMGNTSRSAEPDARETFFCSYTITFFLFQVCLLWRTYIKRENIWRKVVQQRALAAPDLARQNGWAKLIPALGGTEPEDEKVTKEVSEQLWSSSRSVGGSVKYRQVDRQIYYTCQCLVCNIKVYLYPLSNKWGNMGS